MNVYIGGTKDYSAMRGPCPDGFHIPLASEWSAVISAGIDLGAWTSSNSSGVKTYLKIPIGGYRWRSNGVTNEKGSTGIYWCSTFSNGGGNSLNLQSNLVDVGSWHSSVGASIRAFKDEAVIPDNSWTVLKQGTGTAGIYHNSTLGLISISSDGETWYTIADKNIGATTVYNDGNTLSSSNCGNTFQWGNNYKFSWDGSVTTSSTKVNASAYGPGNYYSSSTFILVSGTPSNWDSSDNNNLRGGVTGIVSPAELKNDYVGEYVEETYSLTPGANNTSFYKSGYTVQSITIEGDYYNPSSGYNGAGWYIMQDWDNRFGYYLNGGTNITSNNSSSFLETYESGSRTLLDQTSNYGNAGTTIHVKATIDREKTTIKFGNNAERTYSYSSGSKGNFIRGILDNSSAVIAYYLSGSGTTLTTGTATVVYEKI